MAVLMRNVVPMKIEIELALSLIGAEQTDISALLFGCSSLETACDDLVIWTFVTASINLSSRYKLSFS